MSTRALPRPALSFSPLSSIVLRWDDGLADPLPIDRFLGEPTAEELELLEDLPSPVLDVGCGPGRHVSELTARGVMALGVDTAPAAATLARERGALVLERSVFDLLLGEGRWGSALLFDGTIGIGGDPARLMRRIRALLRHGGWAVVEVYAPGVPVAVLARLEVGRALGPWFPWGRVGADAVGPLAVAAGFRLHSIHEACGRWFARVEAR